ncbi:MAG: dihydroorotate dehydrogenase-like protein [Tannerella sp.]|jgi:dihydroorotate dehydrogenase (fumarate)|nr:dihydroorotate dehydrogenase-like protein [Tannerella sp.]
MTGYETKYAGLTLKNPLIAGSSGLTDSAGRNRELEKAGVGAVVLKSLFEEQMEMQSDVLMHEGDAPDAAAYIRGYVKAGMMEAYLSLIEETKKSCSIPVIASINCYREDTWADFAVQMEAAGADALELNVFYLYTDLDFKPGEALERYVSILRKVKARVSVPVIMKIGKSFTNIPALVNRLKLNGADGVVLFNRYYQPDIDIHAMRTVSGQVFSSRSDLSDTLRWTAFVSGKVPGISIAASTGIHDWEDVVKCLLAGASAVQLCSVLYRQGLEVIPQMLTAMEAWMLRTKYRTTDEFIGKLNFSGTANHMFYERSQFMKYFSGRDEKTS